MAYNTIKIKKYLDIIIEKEAAAALYPGHLLELTSSDTVQKHSTASGNALPPMFALEDELQGNDIDDAYAAGDKVQVWIPQRGEVVYAVLADGQNISIGDALESAGDGTLTAYVADTESHASGEDQSEWSITTYPLQIIGIALEALDLSDSSGAEDSGTLDWDKRIKIMIV